MALCVTKENVEPSKLKELENLEDLVLQQVWKIEDDF